MRRRRTSTRSGRSRRSATCRRRCTPGRSGASGTASRTSRSRSRSSTRRRSIRTRCWSSSWRRASTTTASGPGSGSRSRRSTCTRRRITSPGRTPSGIVWAVGDKVRRWKVGDEVVIHCNQDDGDDEHCNGGDPMYSPSQRIWGYETPNGSFAQFTNVQSQQLMARPKHLTWEESACYTLTLATAYRMLFGHAPHELRPGQNVLVWGASGGLGSFAIQLDQHRGRQRDRGDLGGEQARLRAVARGEGRHQPQGLQVLGADADGQQRRSTRNGSARRASSARRSGTSPARA